MESRDRRLPVSLGLPEVECVIHLSPETHRNDHDRSVSLELSVENSKSLPATEQGGDLPNHGPHAHTINVSSDLDLEVEDESTAQGPSQNKEPYVYSNETVNRADSDYSMPEPHRLPSVLMLQRAGSSAYAEEEEALGRTSVANASGFSSHMDWNERFQLTQELPDDNEQQAMLKFDRLVNLSSDFLAAATTFARLIIFQQFLAPERQIVRPVALGGLAGGTKYVANGMLFKLSRDPFIRGKFLYGDSEAQYELAAKAASHDLKGARIYFNAFASITAKIRARTASATNEGKESVEKDGQSGNEHSRSPTLTREDTEVSSIRVPMQTIVDYLGFRITVMPFIQLHNQVIYGSADAGHTVHKSSNTLNNMMAETAKELHLAEHCVGANHQKLHAAGDVEGRKGHDQRTYLLDLARAMPPEDPSVCAHLPEIGCPVFYRLFRPEFLQILKLNNMPPLSSDALTGWTNGQPDAEEMQTRSRQATEYLLTHIAEYALWIESREHENAGMPRKQFSNQLMQSVHTKFSGDSGRALRLPVSEQVHFMGINIRHIGLLRHYCKEESNRDVLLIECVSRTLKGMLRGWQREELERSSQSQEPSEHSIVRKVVVFLNLATGCHRDSDSFWDNVRKGLQARFGAIALTEVERLDLGPSLLHARGLLATTVKHLASMAALRLSETSTLQFEDQPIMFKFSTTDLAITGLGVRQKIISEMEYAKARLICQQGVLNFHHAQTALRLLVHGIEAFRRDLMSNPMSLPSQRELAIAQSIVAEVGGKNAEADDIIMAALKAHPLLQVQDVLASSSVSEPAEAMATAPMGNLSQLKKNKNKITKHVSLEDRGRQSLRSSPSSKSQSGGKMNGIPENPPVLNTARTDESADGSVLDTDQLILNDEYVPYTNALPPIKGNQLTSSIINKEEDNNNNACAAGKENVQGNPSPEKIKEEAEQEREQEREQARVDGLLFWSAYAGPLVDHLLRLWSLRRGETGSPYKSKVVRECKDIKEKGVEPESSISSSSCSSGRLWEDWRAKRRCIHLDSLCGASSFTALHYVCTLAELFQPDYPGQFGQDDEDRRHALAVDLPNKRVDAVRDTFQKIFVAANPILRTTFVDEGTVASEWGRMLCEPDNDPRDLGQEMEQYLESKARTAALVRTLWYDMLVGALREEDHRAFAVLCELGMINSRDTQGRTALMVFASEGKGLAVQKLIKAGASVWVTDQADLSALGWALRGRQEHIIKEIAKLTSPGKLPLSLAVQLNFTSAVRLFLTSGAPVTLECLTCAVNADNVEMVDVLLAAMVQRHLDKHEAIDQRTVQRGYLYTRLGRRVNCLRGRGRVKSEIKEKFKQTLAHCAELNSETAKGWIDSYIKKWATALCCVVAACAVMTLIYLVYTLGKTQWEATTKYFTWSSCVVYGVIWAHCVLGFLFAILARAVHPSILHSEFIITSVLMMAIGGVHHNFRNGDRQFAEFLIAVAVAQVIIWYMANMLNILFTVRKEIYSSFVTKRKKGRPLKVKQQLTKPPLRSSSMRSLRPLHTLHTMPSLRTEHMRNLPSLNSVRSLWDTENGDKRSPRLFPAVQRGGHTSPFTRPFYQRPDAIGGSAARRFSTFTIDPHARIPVNQKSSLSGSPPSIKGSLISPRAKLSLISPRNKSSPTTPRDKPSPLPTPRGKQSPIPTPRGKLSPSPNPSR